MSPLACAPAFVLLLFYSVFLSLYVSLRYPAGVSLGVASLVSFGWLLIGTEKPNKSSLSLIALLVVMCAAGVLYLRGAVDEPAAQRANIETNAEVLSARRRGFGRAALVKAESGEKFLLMFERGERDVDVGDVIALTGMTQPFERAKEPGGFDEFFYWRAKGAIAKIVNPRVEVVGHERSAATWRAALGAKIRSVLPSQTAGYMLAIVTGERDSRLESLHRSVGTSHLLAVSGFHVGIVFMVGWFFLRCFPFRLWLVSALIWLYVILTGAAPSALRAAFMIQLAIVGRMVGRAGNSFNTASMAGVLLLIFNPWLFWDIGWRLSMLAILAVTSVNASEYSVKAKFLIGSPLVWIATSMQAAWTFESVPISGVIINFFAIPVFTFLFSLALVFSLPALLGMPGGYWIAFAPELLFSMWERLSSNILFLCPWKMSFSLTLVVIGAVALVFSFSAASGFSAFRSVIISVVVSISSFVLLV